MANPVGVGGIVTLQGTVNTAAVPLLLSDFRIAQGRAADGNMPREFTIINNSTNVVWVNVPALHGPQNGTNNCPGFPISSLASMTFKCGKSNGDGTMDYVSAWTTTIANATYSGSALIVAGCTGGG